MNTTSGADRPVTQCRVAAEQSLGSITTVHVEESEFAEIKDDGPWLEEISHF